MMNGRDLYELGKDLGQSNIKMTELMPSWRGSTSPGPAARRGKFGNYLNQSARQSVDQCSRIVRATKFLHGFLAIARLLKIMVARDGIEPPTPAFSGPLTESPKWFEHNGYC
jgi:hypothetical protein